MTFAFVQPKVSCQSGNVRDLRTQLEQFYCSYLILSVDHSNLSQHTCARTSIVRCKNPILREPQWQKPRQVGAFFFNIHCDTHTRTHTHTHVRARTPAQVCTCTLGQGVRTNLPLAGNSMPCGPDFTQCCLNACMSKVVKHQGTHSAA